MKSKHYIAILLSVIGIAFFVYVSTLYPKISITNAFMYQGITLAITIMLIGIARLLFGKFHYLQIGNIAAAATPVKLFGISEKDHWKKFGLTLLFLISFGTLIFMGIGFIQEPVSVTVSGIVFAVLLSVPLSMINAFNEEIATRWLIVEGLQDSAIARYSPWVSALVFGIPHYLGTPGGVIGALMAGFMGWFLARSLQDTRGMFWALVIHFAQDVIIFTTIILSL